MEPRKDKHRDTGTGARMESPLVVVVDDDRDMRDAICELIVSIELDVTGFASTRELLAAGIPDRPGCLVLDARMPGVSGLDLQHHLKTQGVMKPIIFLTAFADIPMTVQAMKAGAIDFLTKPFRDQSLLDAIGQGIAQDLERRELSQSNQRLLDRFSSLTRREKQVCAAVAAGRLNKQIAFDLGISMVTVKLHRGNVMHKMQVRSLGELIHAWGALPAEVRQSLSEPSD